MTTKTLIPFAALGLLFALRTATAEKPRPAPQPTQQPPRSPFRETVAGAGLVEASTENVSVGSQISGVVSAVLVEPGQDVLAGAPLFALDERADRATVLVRRAELASAERRLERLERAPRPETIVPLRAAVAEAEARRDDARVQLERWEKLVSRSAVSEHELSLKRYATLVAERQVDHARADLDLALAGTWEPEVAEARAAVDVAKAELGPALVELERLVVRASVAGRVLRVNVRPGELVQPTTAAVLLGDTGTLHVRVSIDEADAPRLRDGAAARASIKGLPEPTFALRHVRTEPYVVPKRSLTGQTNERVDTRVLEVVYAVEGPRPARLFVGQQVDVFIER